VELLGGRKGHHRDRATACGCCLSLEARGRLGGKFETQPVLLVLPSLISNYTFRNVSSGIGLSLLSTPQKLGSKLAALEIVAASSWEIDLQLPTVTAKAHPREPSPSHTKPCRTEQAKALDPARKSGLGHSPTEPANGGTGTRTGAPVRGGHPGQSTKPYPLSEVQGGAAAHAKQGRPFCPDDPHPIPTARQPPPPPPPPGAGGGGGGASSIYVIVKSAPCPHWGSRIFCLDKEYSCFLALNTCDACEQRA